jgi:putative ABC transport system permease protein
MADEQFLMHRLLPNGEPLINVSTPLVLLTMTPLALVAWASWMMGLNLESPIVVGTIRAFVQLTILGFILKPIFSRGEDWWWLVIAYTIFMVILASYEAVARTKYFFPGMFWFVLATLLANVTCVSLFSFGIILRPDPLWDPQYVIPIVGMLLGNCINGAALSLNSMLTSLVESSREVELMLSFGANSYEASSRLLRDAVRTGAMPQLNTLSIIGIISIPGMMTGQILAGSSVTDAAHYQMLIIYLISICSFGTILTEVYFVIGFTFDSSCMLRTDRLTKRLEKPSLLRQVASWCDWFLSLCYSSPKRRSSEASSLLEIGKSSETFYMAPKGELKVTTFRFGPSRGQKLLKMSGMMGSFVQTQDEEDAGTPIRRILFQDLAFSVDAGEIALVSGPSGAGKSSLLRILAGLAPLDAGIICLGDTMRSSYKDMTIWRQKVRYVPQSKIDIPGTPREFLQRIASLQVCKRGETPSYEDMRATTSDLIQSWGMSSKSLDSEWNILSGGEAQRLLVAVALASRPSVLLLDESTSGLDLDTKIRVEKTIETYCAKHSMSVLWVTHDQDQMERMKKV